MRITTHNGTHLDAPYHFFSTMNHALKPGGEPSWRIDEVPLEWCFQPAVKLDFRHLPDGYVATPGDVEAELKRIGHRLRPLEIVVVNTAASTRYGQDDYVDRGCGMGNELWLARLADEGASSLLPWTRRSAPAPSDRSTCGAIWRAVQRHDIFHLSIANRCSGLGCARLKTFRRLRHR